MRFIFNIPLLCEPG